MWKDPQITKKGKKKIMVKKTNSNEQAKQNYEVEVLRAKDITKKDAKYTTIACDIKINGVTVYGCYYKEGEKNGKDWALIDFPKYKGSDDKYYNVVWFPASKELVSKLADAISFALDNK